MRVAPWLVGGLVLLLGPVAGACTIPVFRYALERWEASTYEVLVFKRGEVAEGDKDVLRAWAKREANVEFRVIDVEKMDGADERIWKQQVGAVVPWVVVRFPESGERSPVVWAGRLEAAGVGVAADSPGRREMARRLMAGESAVWVVLEDSDRGKNDALVSRLEGELRRLERVLVLPEIAADGPQLLSSLPLRLKFSVLRVARDDPKEAALVRMLSVAEPEYFESKETLVVPVIGRARAVSAILGSKFEEGKVGAFAEFICGQCSCEVKEMNPGIDLLIAADWEAVLEEGAGEKVSPVKAGEKVEISPGVVAAQEAVGYVKVFPAPSRSYRNVLVGAICVSGVVAVISVVFAVRAWRKV